MPDIPIEKPTKDFDWRSEPGSYFCAADYPPFEFTEEEKPLLKKKIFQEYLFDGIDLHKEIYEAVSSYKWNFSPEELDTLIKLQERVNWRYWNRNVTLAFRKFRNQEMGTRSLGVTREQQIFG